MQARGSVSATGVGVYARVCRRTDGPTILALERQRSARIRLRAVSYSPRTIRKCFGESLGRELRGGYRVRAQIASIHQVANRGRSSQVIIIVKV